MPTASSGTEDLPYDFSEFLAQRRQLSTDEASSLMLVVARLVGAPPCQAQFLRTVALLRATQCLVYLPAPAAGPGMLLATHAHGNSGSRTDNQGRGNLR